MALSCFLMYMASMCFHESYRPTLKKEAVKSTGTLVCMDKASQRHNPKESNHDFHLRKDSKYQACYFEIPYVNLWRFVIYQNFTRVPEKGKKHDPTSGQIEAVYFLEPQ